MYTTFKLLGNDNITMFMESWNIAVRTGTDIYVRSLENILGARIGEHDRTIAVQIFTLKEGTQKPLDTQIFSLEDYCPEGYAIATEKKTGTFGWKQKGKDGEVGPPILGGLLEDVNGYLSFWGV